jgi:hypothetical protein
MMVLPRRRSLRNTRARDSLSDSLSQLLMSLLQPLLLPPLLLLLAEEQLTEVLEQLLLRQMRVFRLDLDDMLTETLALVRRDAKGRLCGRWLGLGLGLLLLRGGVLRVLQLLLLLRGLLWHLLLRPRLDRLNLLSLLDLLSLLLPLLPFPSEVILISPTQPGLIALVGIIQRIGSLGAIKGLFRWYVTALCDRHRTRLADPDLPHCDKEVQEVEDAGGLWLGLSRLWCRGGRCGERALRRLGWGEGP